ncbi:MAG: hypothetical protein CFH30_00676, partial [Alphaproteobacteria bacterium MarineAlpha8_Bin1]
FLVLDSICLESSTTGPEYKAEIKVKQTKINIKKNFFFNKKYLILEFVTLPALKENA